MLAQISTQTGPKNGGHIRGQVLTINKSYSATQVFHKSRLDPGATVQPPEIEENRPDRGNKRVGARYELETAIPNKGGSDEIL